MTNSSYATDLTDDQWQIIKDLLPPPKRGGRPRTVCLRQSLNAMFYLLTMVRTVYGYFRAFQEDGTWRRMHRLELPR